MRASGQCRERGREYIYCGARRYIARTHSERPPTYTHAHLNNTARRMRRGTPFLRARESVMDSTLTLTIIPIKREELSQACCAVQMMYKTSSAQHCTCQYEREGGRWPCAGCTIEQHGSDSREAKQSILKTKIEEKMCEQGWGG